MTKSRLVLADILKILAALLVINTHYEALLVKHSFSPFFYLGWYAVPIFIVISFYFNRQDTAKRIKRLLIPLLFWSVIGFLAEPDFFSLKRVLRQLLLGTVVDVPLYYLNMMIYFTLAGHFLKRFSGSLLVIFLLIELSGLSRIIITMAPYPAQFFLTRFLEFGKYVAFGSLLAGFSAKLRFPPRLALLGFFLISLMDITQLWRSQTDVILYSGWQQFLGVGLLIFWATRQPFPLVSKIVSFLSKYTLGIYCLHFIFIQILSRYPFPALLWHWPMVIGIFSLCLFFSYLIDKLSCGRLKAVVS